MFLRPLTRFALAACLPALATAAAPPAGELRTRVAMFRVVPFEQLPGWDADHHAEAWDAFMQSCNTLARREGWRELCAEARTLRVGESSALRSYFERHFTLLAVQPADSAAEGNITGYYEPLLAGRQSPGGAFVVPVHAAPRDLYTLDWRLIPTAQRKGVVTVRPVGRTLLPAGARAAGALGIDLRDFRFDALDRRLRVRISDKRGLPYYARSEIDTMPRLDAPVLAWVNDPLALYAMQVQGSGRIRMADGTTLRLRFAEQNGHPFRPLRIAAVARERGEGVRTRAIGTSAGEEEEPQGFELADLPALAAEAPLTRAIGPAPRATQSDVDAVVDHLLGQTPSAPRAQHAKPPSAPRAQENAGPPFRPAGDGHGGAAAGSARSPVEGTTAAQRDERTRRLAADPSYVFFQVAADQSPRAGPIGAFGVPLTAGRSLAVDPRVTPLGYPVYLSAHGADGSGIERLAFAQDTGGAIRGAGRADFYWGFGAQAGRDALRTRHSGRMWVMLPHAEARAALAEVPRKRSIGVPKEEPRECLLADEAYCEP